MSPEQQELLRRLALSNERVAGTALDPSGGTSAASSLDPPTLALAQVAALIATEAPLASYQWGGGVGTRRGGQRHADIVDVLVAVAPVVGLARVAAAAPEELALALGYDVESPSGE